LGLEIGLGLDDFRFSGLGLGLGEKALGLATMGFDYISVLRLNISIYQLKYSI